MKNVASLHFALSLGGQGDERDHKMERHTIELRSLVHRHAAKRLVLSGDGNSGMRLPLCTSLSHL